MVLLGEDGIATRKDRWEGLPELKRERGSDTKTTEKNRERKSTYEDKKKSDEIVIGSGWKGRSEEVLKKMDQACPNRL